MIINNRESLLEFQNEDLSTTPTLMQDFSLHPTKYREFKQDINRINNIDNEINFLRSQQQFSQVNFFKSLIISKQDYDEAATVANDIVARISEEEISDILSHKKLLSFQRNILEIFCYFIGYDYFDWKMIRDKLTLYEAKSKMSNVDYHKLERKRVNAFLNKICKNNKGFINGIPQNICTDAGMDVVYEWIRAQIKIFLYLYQRGTFKKTLYPPSPQDNDNDNYNMKSKTQEEDQTLTQYNQTHSTIKAKISSVYNNNNPKQNNIYRIVFDVNNNNNYNSNNYSNPLSRDSYPNEEIVIPPSKSNFNFNNEIKKSFKVLSSSMNVHHDSKKYNNDLLITSLPDLNKTSHKVQSVKVGNEQQSVNAYNYVDNKKPLFHIKNNYLLLKGVNHDRDHLKREEKFFENLPLLKYRTFQQMRNFYNMKSKINHRIEQRHFDDIKSSSLSEGKNSNKIISLIAQKKISVLNKMTLYKLQQIIYEK